MSVDDLEAIGFDMGKHHFEDGGFTIDPHDKIEELAAEILGAFDVDDEEDLEIGELAKTSIDDDFVPGSEPLAEYTAKSVSEDLKPETQDVATDKKSDDISSFIVEDDFSRYIGEDAE
jgi:hypothetical protein